MDIIIIMVPANKIGFVGLLTLSGLLLVYDGQWIAQPKGHLVHKVRHNEIILGDLEPFSYIHCPRCRLSEQLDMVIIVTSNARNFNVRKGQREAFPAHELKSMRIRRFFLLAKDENVSQDDILHESHSFGDIIQGDFIEHYHNLSYKHLMGLHWTSHYCQHARYVLKMDDDILVDVYQMMLKLVSDYPTMDKVMLGYKQIGLHPERNPKSKWFVSERDYPSKTYPDFLSGWAYVTKPETCQKLVDAAQGVKPFWIDDLWISGFLAPSQEISLRSLNSLFTVYEELINCCLDKQHQSPDPEKAIFMCDFIVGPSMNNIDLMRRFGSLSRTCHLIHPDRCERRKWDESLSKVCVNVKNPLFLPNSEGVGEVIPLSNRL